MLIQFYEVAIDMRVDSSIRFIFASIIDEFYFRFAFGIVKMFGYIDVYFHGTIIAQPYRISKRLDNDSTTC